MELKVLDGKKEPIEIRKKKLMKKVEQLKYFVSHMRTLETSIASIKVMASKIEWVELDERLSECHKNILDTLSFVKNSTKQNKQGILDLENPIIKPNHLKLAKSKSE